METHIRIDEVNTKADDYNVNRVLKDATIKQEDSISGVPFDVSQRGGKNQEIAILLNQMKKDPTHLSVLDLDDADDPTNLKNTEHKVAIVTCVEEVDEESSPSTKMMKFRDLFQQEF